MPAPPPSSAFRAGCRAHSEAPSKSSRHTGRPRLGYLRRRLAKRAGKKPSTVFSEHPPRMAPIGRRAYAEMFGPTVGDRLRLADTGLILEVEADYTLRAGSYGEE